ncbi:hypothetical protein O3M35_008998 [Rhynocoris fuscipes]|uniref:H/ACA ribonucleoprotein complex non-core subunit NAF1 n=1 Tax=Rhynocoris fuscipes TaxID=488301 RepID=A0AAW1D3M1_9HEMI
MEDSEKRNSLALISASYDSSDSDSCSVISTVAQRFAERQTETLSSSSTSNSEDSDSEDSESDLESIICRKPSFIPKQIRVKGELSVQDLPPIEDLHITVKEEECLPFGKVYSIVDTLLVIQSLPDKPALNLDSVFFRYNGAPIGRIFDVFGPVKRPFYSVRFNTNKEILDKGLVVDTVLYAAPQTQHAQYVFAQNLMKEKGSDASWVNDCEPPAECLDYSDDEQERDSTRKQKKSVPIKEEKIDDELEVKKKYLSFEERMNKNNSLRNKYFNSRMRPSCSYKNRFDLGWHNRIEGPVKSGYGRAMEIRSPSGGGMLQMRAPMLIAPPPIAPQSPLRCSLPPQFPPDYHRPMFDPRYPPPGWSNTSTSMNFSLPSGRLPPPQPNMAAPPNIFYDRSPPPFIHPHQPFIPASQTPSAPGPPDSFYFSNYSNGDNSF